MAVVARLITYADVNDWAEQPAGQMSCSAVLAAELADGRELVLLDDRGWSETVFTVGGGRFCDPWRHVTRDDIEETARTVVGPDEPLDGDSHEDAARMHWSYLAGVLEQHGVTASAHDLQVLPHAVVLSDRLLARIAGPARP